jgi:hypothetical protein
MLGGNALSLDVIAIIECGCLVNVNACFGLARTVYVYTVHDCVFGDFPAKNVICIGLARTVCIYNVYDRILGDIPAKITVCTPYMHGSGQPYSIDMRQALIEVRI